MHGNPPEFDPDVGAGDGAPSEAAVRAICDGMAVANSRMGAATLSLFGFIAAGDDAGVWERDGARDMAHWVAMRLGISEWKARRWIGAAHALQDLPRIAEALGRGELSVDKVAELARFATPERERTLLAWAGRVSCAAIRRRGDEALGRSLQGVREAELARSVRSWYDPEQTRYELHASMPAACGPVVDGALEHLAGSLPVMPGEEGPGFEDARWADALMALASGVLGGGVPRATVVVHATVEAAPGGTAGTEGPVLAAASVEGGPALHPHTLARLVCDARVQVLVHDPSGRPLGRGRMRRIPPPWMARAVRHRDSECVFPGCGARRFTQVHHVRWFTRGGPTEPENLALVCCFHHRLVHEHGWGMRRVPGGEVAWFHPDGTRYRAGPPPGGTVRREATGALVMAGA